MRPNPLGAARDAKRRGTDAQTATACVTRKQQRMLLEIRVKTGMRGRMETASKSGGTLPRPNQPIRLNRMEGSMKPTRIRPVCAYPDCSEITTGLVGRGLCASHYHRASRAGILGDYPTTRFASIEDRFFSKVDSSGVCWEWNSGVNEKGYGRFDQSYAHRWAYQFLVAPIPADMTIDHLCRNIICVNPDHLEVVTLLENIKRAHPRRETCSRGHTMDDAYIRREGTRMCRTCQNFRNRNAKRGSRAKPRCHTNYEKEAA